jgi:DNA-directed RNA polymerase subunit RPC12/RpoP
MEVATVFLVVGGIAVLALLVTLRMRNVTKGKDRAAAATAVDDYRRTRDKADLGRVCPVCGGVAEPIGDTYDRYRCAGCGHEFRAESHEWKIT